MTALSDLRLLVHAYCPSSYALVRYLFDKGLHDKLEIIPLNPGNPVSLLRLVPSVPALASDGRIVAVDPLEPEFIGALLLNKNIRNYVPISEHEVIERFTRSAKSSGYIMLHVLLGGLSLDDLVSSEFTDMATRTYFSGLSRDYIRSVLLSRAEAIERELLESSVKSVAYSFIRDVLVSTDVDLEKLVDYRVLKLWSTAKLSQGIVYTPLRELFLNSNIRKVLEYIQEHYDRLVKSFENFIAKLSSDTEVYRLLSEGNVRRRARSSTFS